jgi:hypothetical protein
MREYDMRRTGGVETGGNNQDRTKDGSLGGECLPGKTGNDGMTSKGLAKELA